ncbi:MAG: formate dehydrogenase accessory sulfurtransferase FdhD [Nitrospirae bacterium]|nr:MAG: formate dehydrogenase accessory sulfurtransferase FdhD [Nitrospirota bacterium]
MRGLEKVEITRINGSEQHRIEDIIATEKKLRILINGDEILKLYCSPVMIRELVVGFMMTEGIIEGSWCAERMSIEYNDEVVVDIPSEGKVNLEGGTITSGCVGGITFERSKEEGIITGGPVITPAKLKELFRKFQKASQLYNQTGCIHSAAISDGRRLLVLAEDIGRHNAVDKAVGFCLLEDIPLDDKIILVSGRLSSEMAEKCSRWSIPIVVSRTAPTSRAIDIARKRGITMVGFMRGERFNIYTFPERVAED